MSEEREALNACIREIFLANGFTIKEGQTDLKPYVYQAAHALLWATGYFSACPLASATNCPHDVDDGACKQCYTEATGREPVAWMYEGTRIGTQFSGARLDHYFSKPEGGYIKGKPLYAAPIGDNGAQPDACMKCGVHPDSLVASCTAKDCPTFPSASQPAESKPVELTEGQVIEAIQKSCGEYRHGCSYSFEDVWNCIEAALLARAQAKGE